MTGAPSDSLTKEQAQAEIDRVNSSPTHPYWNGSDPGHKEAVEGVTKIFRRLAWSPEQEENFRAEQRAAADAEVSALWARREEEVTRGKFESAAEGFKKDLEVAGRSVNYGQTINIVSPAGAFYRAFRNEGLVDESFLPFMLESGLEAEIESLDFQKFKGILAKFRDWKEGEQK